MRCSKAPSLFEGVDLQLLLFSSRWVPARVQCLRSRGLKPYKLGDMDFDNYTRILAQFP